MFVGHRSVVTLTVVRLPQDYANYDTIKAKPWMWKWAPSASWFCFINDNGDSKSPPGRPPVRSRRSVAIASRLCEPAFC